jgi:hypothetical protein
MKGKLHDCWSWEQNLLEFAYVFGIECSNLCQRHTVIPQIQRVSHQLVKQFIYYLNLVLQVMGSYLSSVINC